MKEAKLIKENNERLQENYIEFLEEIELEVKEDDEEKELDVVELDLLKEESDVKKGEEWYLAYVLNRKESLAREEQLRLLTIYHNACDKNEKDAVFNILVEANQKLVLSIAKKYKTQETELDDLIQEGNMGLFKAIEKFDISTNNALSTYATYWIEQYIGRYVHNNKSQIRIPINMLKKVYKYRRLIAEAQSTGQAALSNKDLSKMINCTPKQLVEIIYYSNLIETVSLYAPVKGKGAEGIMDSIKIQDLIPSKIEEPNRFKNLENEIKNILDERLYDILCRRYGMGEYLEPQTLKKVSAIYGVSKERIRQLQNKAETKIKNDENIRMLIY